MFRAGNGRSKVHLGETCEDGEVHLITNVETTTAVTADVDRTAPTGREMTLRPRERHEALQEASREQETAAWKTEYAVRAGIEGTISERVRGSACAAAGTLACRRPVFIT